MGDQSDIQKNSKENSKDKPRLNSKEDCLDSARWTVKKFSGGSGSKKPTPESKSSQRKSGQSKSLSKNESDGTYRRYTAMRFLPGSVDAISMLKDLQEYADHRERIRMMKPAIRITPPHFPVATYVTKNKLREETIAYFGIYDQNRRLLMRINEINRHGGKVDCYHTSVLPVSEKSSNMAEQEARLKRIEQNNKRLYQDLLNAESRYSRKEMVEHSKAILREMKMRCKMPIVIFDKQDPDLLLMTKPSIGSHLKIPKNPKIRQLAFMEFKVKDGPYLGRIVIELYKDFTPVTVQNFLELCKGHKKLCYRNCPVHRIVPGKFLVSGDITLGTGRGGYSIYGKEFHEEKRILRHSRPGVLSMVPIRGTKNNSQFSISFTELPQFDGCNVVFGNVIEGIKTICDIESYGRKIGKPLSEIYISNCGEYQWQHLKYKLFPDSYYVQEDNKNETVDKAHTVKNSKYRNRRQKEI